MKNISIFITSLAGGGGEREASILANNFSEDNQVYLNMLNDTISYELSDRVQIDYLENTPARKRNLYNILKIPMLARRYAKYCKDNNIDLVLSFMPRPNIIASLSKRYGNPAKIINCEVTTLSKAYSTDRWTNRLMRKLIRIAYPMSDLAIANSKGSEKELREIFGVKNTTTIYNPLEIKLISQRAKEVPKKPPSSEKFTFIKVARFAYPKDFKTLLTAYSQIKNIEQSELYLLGTGPEMEDTQKLAKDLGIENNVIFTGFESNPFSYLSRADSFVFSSLHEGFPNSMQEALACGLPVISNDCQNGPREMLAPELSTEDDPFADEKIYIAGSGILVPTSAIDSYTAAMERMMEDKDLYKELQKGALARAQDFDTKKILEEFKTKI